MEQKTRVLGHTNDCLRIPSLDSNVQIPIRYFFQQKAKIGPKKEDKKPGTNRLKKILTLLKGPNPGTLQPLVEVLEKKLLHSNGPQIFSQVYVFPIILS
jgi:hypothetical protein